MRAKFKFQISNFKFINYKSNKMSLQKETIKKIKIAFEIE